MNSPLRAVKASINQPEAQAAAPKQDMFAASLLAFESEVWEIRDEQELLAHLCNTSRRILPYRQSFVFKKRAGQADFKLCAASSVAVIDRNAPFMRWAEKLVKRLTTEVEASEQHYFALPAYCDDTDEEKDTYPFPELLWTPLIDGDKVIGGFLSTRETPWGEYDRTIADRLAKLYAHSWRAIKGQNRLSKQKIFTRARVAMIALLVCLIGIIPVSVTALAPVEVSPKDPFVIAAPFDGVVRELLVDQGINVTAGAPMVAFEDVRLRNEFEVADQEKAVAEARYQRASQSAISDARAKRDIEVLRAEYELATVRRDYAAELLNQATITAPSDGMTIYTDKRDWEGRPVAAGEAILQLADPQEIQFEVDLPVKDSLVLREGTRVKIFLDSDPLTPLEAILTEASYQSRPDKRDIMSYSVSARLADDEQAPPRIGVQGTAQIYSNKAPLVFALLRRPLAFMRQLTGW